MTTIFTKGMVEALKQPITEQIKSAGFWNVCALMVVYSLVLHFSNAIVKYFPNYRSIFLLNASM
ncbi:hypothetical protein ACTXT7_005551 [Hymenolepis weldensis]